MNARDEIAESLRILRVLPALELEPVARALACTAREVDPDPSIVSGPPARYFVLDGPGRAIVERKLEIRGARPFVVLELRIADAVALGPADVEPELLDLPFAFLPNHVSMPSGPMITGVSYQLAVPAGTLWLTFEDAAETRFGAPGLSARIGAVVDGVATTTRLERIVLNNDVPKLDPESTLRKFRAWAG